MKRILCFSAGLLLTSLVFTACNDNAPATTTTDKKDSTTVSLKEEEVTYSDHGDTLKGFVVYDENKTGKRPAVLVVPEWWGMTDYPKFRARELARLGYIAMAVDFYGNGKIADNPQIAMASAKPFYENPAAARSRMEAALAKIKEYPATDSSKVAAIGYCFGGAMVLNAARLGMNLKTVVSFHGEPVGVKPDKALLKASVLVCNGAADSFVKPESIALFKKQMDSIGAVYSFKDYAGVTHAFTNPAATETGKKFNMPIEYNAAADTASWKDMQSFFDQHLK